MSLIVEISHLHEHISEHSDSQVFEAMIKLNVFIIKYCSFKVMLSIETSNIDIIPVSTERVVLEYRDNSKLLARFGNFKHRGFWWKLPKQSFSHLCSSTKVIFSIETSKIEKKSEGMERVGFESRDTLNFQPFLELAYPSEADATIQQNGFSIEPTFTITAFLIEKLLEQSNL